MISQSMVVPVYGIAVKFDLWAYTANPNASMGTQTVTLRAGNGSILYTKETNINSTTPIAFAIPLSGTSVGEVITLEISTYTNSQAGASSQVSLYLDNVFIYRQVLAIPGPEPPPGGGM